MTSDITANLRPMTTPADYEAILRFVGECTHLTGGCGYLHPGDVRHNISNALRGIAPELYFHLYEEAGSVQAVVVMYPTAFAGFDLMLHPDRRGGELEAALLAWGQAATWSMMRAAASEKDYVGSDVMDCDHTRRDLLLAAGYRPQGEPYMVYTARPLTHIPDTTLPPGFTIRAAHGEQESEALGEVHSASFNSDWSNNAYLPVMRSPAYQADHELLVVAPDGRLAAFLIYWCDPVSRSGLFEPVGCHRDFQRRGLTKALMYEVMRRMVAEGMTEAVVKYEPDNPPAVALYTAAGFSLKYTITDYRKPMGETL